jgi:hypothetical protein
MSPSILSTLRSGVTMIRKWRLRSPGLVVGGRDPVPSPGAVRGRYPGGLGTRRVRRCSVRNRSLCARKGTNPIPNSRRRISLRDSCFSVSRAHGGRQEPRLLFHSWPPAAVPARVEAHPWHPPHGLVSFAGVHSARQRERTHSRSFNSQKSYDIRCFILARARRAARALGLGDPPPGRGPRATRGAADAGTNPLPKYRVDGELWKTAALKRARRLRNKPHANLNGTPRGGKTYDPRDPLFILFVFSLLLLLYSPRPLRPLR